MITDAEGNRHPFDRVVVAANARQALRLTESISELAAVSEQLGRFEYFDTRIAIHGDRRLMPDDESAWSVVNVRWDGIAQLAVDLGSRAPGCRSSRAG